MQKAIKLQKNAGHPLSAITYWVNARPYTSADARGGSDSIQLGSDEDAEILCDACGENQQISPADGYCVNCSDCLCQHCIKCHKTNRASRHHILFDKSKIPTLRNSQKGKDACSIHGSIIEYYCSSCDLFGCSCLATGHQSCTVHFIPSILADLDIFQENRNYKERLSNLRQKLMMNRRKYQSNCAAADVFKERAKRDLMRQRKKLNDFFDNLERQTENKIDQIRDEDGEKMEEISKQYDQLESELYNLSKKMRKDESGEMCQMLVYMKLSEDTFKDLEDKIAELSEENKICKYELFMSKEIRRLIERQKSFVVLSNKYTGWKRKVEFCGKINIKVASDEKHWNIKGMCMLNANLLVAADLRNECVKLFEIRKAGNKSASVDIKLSSWPWDVTKVTDEQVAVTLPDVGLVCFLSEFSMSNESLPCRKFKSSTIHVGHECRGIKCSEGKLIITFTSDPGMIKIFNLEGVILQRFSTGPDGEELFISPYYLTLGHDKRIIYVTDYQKNNVISLDMDGVVKDIIKNDDLRSPGGLVVDRAGSVFVCGSRFYNVHQLDSDLSYIQLLLDHSNAQERPQCIAYCPETNIIFIGMEYKSYINMFRLL